MQAGPGIVLGASDEIGEPGALARHVAIGGLLDADASVTDVRIESVN